MQSNNIFNIVGNFYIKLHPGNPNPSRHFNLPNNKALYVILSKFLQNSQESNMKSAFNAMLAPYYWKFFSEKWRVGYSPSFVFDSGKTGNTWKYRNRTGSSRKMEQRILPIPCHSIKIREKVLFQRDYRFYRWKYRLPYTEVGQINFYFTCRKHKT